VGRRTQAHQGPARRDPPVDGGPGPHSRQAPETQGRPSLSVGPIFARTVRHFFPELNSWLDGLPDPRCQEWVVYHRRFLFYYGILLFAGRLGSRRQLDFRYREEGTSVLVNLNRLAETDQDSIPCNDTLDDYLALLGTGPIATVRALMLNRLLRMRVLDPGRVQGRLVLAMDGSGYLVFRWRHCEHCLTRKCGEHTLYCHQVLEAKLLGPAETVFSVGTEFIDNHDLAGTPAKAGEEQRKQDCELKASRRLLAAFRQEFPQVWLCLTLDALYACGAGFQLGKDFNASYVIVFKEGSIPTLYQEFQTLLGLSPENRLEKADKDGWKHEYRWVNDLPYTDSDRREWKLKAIQYRGEGPNGEKSQWAWLVSADLVVSAATVEAIAWGAGRARWRQENQGFNEQKNGGMNLEHAYSEGEHFGVYYLLLQVAHIMTQLLEKGSLLRALAQQAGKRCAVGLLGGLKNIAFALVESLRNLVWPDEAFAPPGKMQIRLDSG